VVPGSRGKRSATKYKVLLHAAVPKELKKLPATIRRRAKATIDKLADEPIPVGAGRIRGRENAYRLRIGNYRIVYEVHVTEIVVYVVGIAHRREIYRRILERR
jgi:mRNA interferase RelE/StbE